MKRTFAKIFPELFAAAALAAPAMGADLRELLAATRTAQKTGEIILVVDRTLTLWKKSDAGAWQKTLEAPCGYGKLGLTENKREGDKKTPVGAFPILHAFGNKPNPGTAMKWCSVTPSSYWADDVNQPKIYNTWVESAKKIHGEHLADYYQYDYAMAVGYNADPAVPGRGSAIFVHVKSRNRWTTAGCISLERRDMIELLRQCHDGAWIVIVPKAERLVRF